MSVSVFEKETLASVILPDGGEVSRDRLRPKPLQGENYDKCYDFYSIFYDAFLTDDGQYIRLIGPPLANFSGHVLAGDIFQITLGGQRQALPFKVSQKLKVTCVDVELGQPLEKGMRLELQLGALGKYSLMVNPNEKQIFADRRVVFTLFKFEPLEWLRDWVEFNVKYHGADAFLVFQNNSDEFTTSEVAKIINSVDGVKSGAAINWPFPYGPNGIGERYWESNFCQMGAMAHARWRYLSQAKSVLNADLDEIVITGGHRSIFDIVEASTHKYVQIPCKWAGYGGSDDRQEDFLKRRHKHMTHFVEASDGVPAKTKWAVLPRFCSEDSRWIPHNIGRMRGDFLDYEVAGVRHFRDLNTHWKLKRESGPGKAIKDYALEEAYKKIGWM